MSVYKRGDTYWYSFLFAGRRIQESAKTHSKTVAKDAERQRRRELEQGYNNIPERRAARIGTYEDLADAFLEEYKIKHERSAVFATYSIGHTVRHLGRMMVVDLDAETVKGYQTARLKEGTAPKSINDEVVFLLRILGDQGDAIRSRLRRARALKLATTERIGKPYSPDQRARLLAHANAATETPVRSGPGRSRELDRPSSGPCWNWRSTAGCAAARCAN